MSNQPTFPFPSSPVPQEVSLNNDNHQLHETIKQMQAKIEELTLLREERANEEAEIYQQQQQQPVIPSYSSAYTKIGNTRSIDMIGLPKHVFKVQEFTKLLLFGGAAAFFIFTLGAMAKIAATNSKNKTLIKLFKACPECINKL